MKLFRGRIFTPTGDPFDSPEAFLHLEDGMIAVEGGKITAIGEADQFRDLEAEKFNLDRRYLMVPGFVDLHLHAPQLDMIGSYGGHLLEWLERYTFPHEAKFSDPAHASRLARRFFDEMYRHGTLTALIFSTIHSEATDILFSEAERRRFRAILGKTMMDRNAPAALLEDPEESYAESRRLAEKWSRGHSRIGYAITPRFAPTSTPRLLELAGRLREEFPEAWVHTHISESLAEIAWVSTLFPDARGYLDVYDRYGLIGAKTVLAHAVHLTDAQMDVLAEREARIAHCPTSNLFLGSGLFPMAPMLERGIRVGLGTDIGAGTTLSMFTVMADAYKVQQVRGHVLSPLHLWYLATLGGARALGLEQVTGSLQKGKDADFLILDLEATPLLAARSSAAVTTEELLAALIFLGDDRTIAECRVEGDRLWVRENRPAGSPFALQPASADSQEVSP
ncbi:MAG TPA: guanine deaminase [Thermoanaerobaculia bacterium]|nr:guanine deaminase [Thermoanaerobaculia bacterium]